MQFPASLAISSQSALDGRKLKLLSEPSFVDRTHRSIESS
jgi:hypothetical protein